MVAVQEASTRWAGVTEPIVPVRATGGVDAWWEQVVGLSNVDGLVNVNLPSAVAESVAARLGLPVVDIARIDEEGRTQFTTHPAALAASTPDGEADSWIMAAEDASLWQRVAAGDYYPHRVEDLSQVPVTRLAGRAATDEICRAQIQGRTWLDAVVSDFAEHKAVNVFPVTPAVLVAAKSNSLRSYVQFWNLRALRPLRFARAPMALLPVNENVNWSQLGEDLAHHLRRPDEVEPDVLLCAVNVDETTVDELGASLGLVPSSVEPYARWSSPPPPLRQRPYTYRQNINPRQFVVFERDYGQTATTTVQVYGQDTRIEFDSPVRFNGSGRALLHLESDLFAGLPRRPVTASMILNDATWAGDKLQIAVYAEDRYQIEVRVPSLHDAAWALLRDVCARAEPSDKGRMARRLLERGGYEVLLDRNVRRAIDALKTPRSKNVTALLERLYADDQLRDAIDDLALSLGETQQRRFQSVEQLRSAAGAQGAKSAERLCHQGWAERGLSIRCDSCSVRSFVTLSETAPESECPACQAAQPYEVDSTSGAPQLQYRLHALIDRAADQGVLPHLLAIAALREEHDHTFLIPGANVLLGDDTLREVDLFGTHKGTVVAGEAKTSPTGFEDADLEADIELSAALGADAHLMVATEEIAHETLERVHQIARDANLGLILVQGQDVTTVERID